MSAAQKRNIAKVAKASRKAEAKREAKVKKDAAKQRASLDSASKKALQEHMAWMATQTKRVAKEKKKRAKRYAGGKGGALMYT
jgi:N-acetylmuramoyl-L-alanine amidase CwlA